MTRKQTINDETNGTDEDIALTSVTDKRTNLTKQIRQTKTITKESMTNKQTKRAKKRSNQN